MNLAVMSYLDAKVYRTADGTRAWAQEGMTTWWIYGLIEEDLWMLDRIYIV